MKVWPIDPLVPRNLRLEVPEKLPQGSATQLSLGRAPAGTARVGIQSWLCIWFRGCLRAIRGRLTPISA